MKKELQKLRSENDRLKLNIKPIDGSSNSSTNEIDKLINKSKDILNTSITSKNCEVKDSQFIM